MATADDRGPPCPVHDLADAHFVVLGAGGLGCPALLGLQMGGARHLTIVDHDHVQGHNLQRQVLYTHADIGAAKAQVAAHALRRRTPGVQVVVRRERLTPRTVHELVARAGTRAVVVECTDDPALKFAANDAGLRHGTRVVIAAALGWRGQAIAVDAAHACYRCIYESPPPVASTPTCAEAGVVGSAVGFVGFAAAHLAMRLVTSPDDVCGQLHTVDLLSGSARPFRPTIRRGCPGPHVTPTPSETNTAKDHHGQGSNPHPAS